MRRDLFHADIERGLLFDRIFRDLFQVVRGCDADELFQRLDDVLLRDFLALHGNLAAFHAARGFHNHVVPDFQLIFFRVKVVHLAHIFKSNANYLGHRLPPNHRKTDGFLFRIRSCNFYAFRPWDAARIRAQKVVTNNAALAFWSCAFCALCAYSKRRIN